MIKTFCLGVLTCAALTVPAFAQDDIEYPAPTPFYPFQRSFVAPVPVVIPPYRHLFRVRVYSTPQEQPYYNVPPYPVLTPY